MRDGLKPALWTGVGAAIMEFIYCLAAMFGMSALVKNSFGNIFVQGLAFGILVIFGVRHVFVHPKQIIYNNGGNSEFIKRHHIHNTILVGAILYISNPTFIFFWITLAGIIQSYKIIIAGPFDNFLFSIGVGAGVVLWFYILLRFIQNKIVEFQAKTIARFHHISGVILLLFAAYLGYEIIKRLIN
jgi:threonine/homoserine/homoserine lactone efflux protein